MCPITKNKIITKMELSGTGSNNDSISVKSPLGEGQ
jgi:hypothetical protein